MVCVPVYSDYDSFPATLRAGGVSGICLLFASWLSDVDVETMVIFQRNCNDCVRYAPALEARIRSYHMHDSFRECIRISEYDIMLRHSFTRLTDFMHECQHV